MSEFNTILWAPWRMEYILSLADENKEGCFLCRYGNAPDQDAANHVVWRTDHTFIVMNRFPYTNGHLLISPYEHKEDLNDLTEDVFNDLWRQTRDAKTVLTETMHPNGFNIGINFGLSAGAGLPAHIHMHIVPRWTGDTNFMAVLGDVRVVPESLDRTYEHICAARSRLSFPRISDKPSS